MLAMPPNSRNRIAGLGSRRGLTLIELLVVLSVTALLMAIALPALVKVRRLARAAICMSNQRQTALSANLYAADHNQRYMESVATLGSEPDWNWKGPTVITNIRSRAPHVAQQHTRPSHLSIQPSVSQYFGMISSSFYLTSRRRRNTILSVRTGKKLSRQVQRFSGHVLRT